MKRFVLFAGVIIALALAGCRFSHVDYTPQPQRITNKEKAKAILTKLLAEQPRQNGVQQLMVYDDRFTFSHEKMSVPGVAITSGTTIYFARINAIKLYEHNRTGTYNIDLYNKVKVYAVRCFDLSDAENFIDAFTFMQKYNQLKSEEKI